MDSLPAEVPHFHSGIQQVEVAEILEQFEPK
jgi:hypothetical protein